jgi:branched-subunit amino acid transport protein
VNDLPSSPEVWLAIVLAGVGTFAMRASFLALAHRLSEVPPWAQRILRQIPPAALASLVLPAFLRPEGSFSLWTPELAAGLVATFVAWKTRSAALTLVVGLALLMLLEQL